MKSSKRWTGTAAIYACLVAVSLSGCNGWEGVAPPPNPLGTLSDPVWQNQELNAEMSDFVIYEHEFQRGSSRLNTYGEDHLKKIAARIQQGQDATVVVERSMISARSDTKHQYPVHPNPEFDAQRRDIVVAALTVLNVQDAHDRVMIAPALAQGITGNEGEAAYVNAMQETQFGGGMGAGGGIMFGGGGGFY